METLGLTLIGIAIVTADSDNLIYPLMILAAGVIAILIGGKKNNC